MEGGVKGGNGSERKKEMEKKTVKGKDMHCDASAFSPGCTD